MPEPARPDLDAGARDRLNGLPAADRLAAARQDQRQRWLLGQRVPAEAYLDAVPGLADDPEASLDLIYNEVVLREDLGERPAEAEYAARFPRHADAVRRQFAVHRLFDDKASQTTGLGPQSTIDEPDPGPRPPSERTVRQEPGHIRATASRRRLVRWLVAGGCLAAASVVALVGGPWRGGTAPGPNPADDGPPVTGELVLTVWSRDGRKAGRRIGADAEALPVLAGEEVHAQARFDRPAFAYLLRIDPAGTAAPLWPWTAGPAAAALADPPPVLGPVEEVHSPADPRRGWPAGGRSGLETVVLLARRSPLPAEVSLAALVERLPPAKLRRPQEAGLFGTGLPGPAEVIPAGELSAADIALGQLLGRLREHFDLVRAQRYAIWGH